MISQKVKVHNAKTIPRCYWENVFYNLGQATLKHVISEAQRLLKNKLDGYVITLNEHDFLLDLRKYNNVLSHIYKTWCVFHFPFYIRIDMADGSFK